MEALVASLLGRPQQHRDRQTPAGVATFAASAALLAVALVVLARRIAGAVQRPAPAWLLISAAIVVGVYAWWSRHAVVASAIPSKSSKTPRRLDYLALWSPSAAIGLMALGLSWPFARSVDWLWAPLWVADFYWRASLFSLKPPRSAGAGNLEAPQNQRQTAAAANELVADSPEDALIQQLTRVRDSAGRDLITGLLRAEFATGQRTAEVYIAFCPPFGNTPTVEFEQSDGPPARLTIGQLVPHGARLDVRLNEAAARDGYVEVAFFAAESTARGDSRAHGPGL